MCSAAAHGPPRGDQAVHLATYVVAHQREVEDVAELVQHGRVAVRHAAAVEHRQVEPDADAVRSGLGDAEGAAPARQGAGVREREDLHEAVHLGDEAPRVRAGTVDRGEDPAAVLRPDAVREAQAGAARGGVDRDRPVRPRLGRTGGVGGSDFHVQQPQPRDGQREDARERHAQPADRRGRHVHPVIARAPGGLSQARRRISSR